MKVAIDMRVWNWAGVGRYLRNLVKEMLVIDAKVLIIGVVGENDEQEVKEYFSDEIARGQMMIKIVDGSYYSWVEQIKLPGQLAAVEADLWHFTHFNVPLMFSWPCVVTIHDVTRFIFPGQTEQRWLRQMAYELVFAKAVAKAKAVIYVSETTKHDLHELPLKIGGAEKVIYEGVDKAFLNEPDKQHRQRARMLVGTQDEYLLYVGVWMGHKNLKRSLMAFKEMLKTRPDLKMVMTGRPKRGYVDVPGIARGLKLKEDQVLYLGHVPDGLLPALYAEAACLLFPSLYEGFGLPAIEAMAVGCPVLTSSVSSLPEVAGEGAVLVNPEQIDSIIGGLKKVLGDDEYRRDLAAKGRMQIAKFNWRRCARETLQVYGSVTSNA